MTAEQNKTVVRKIIEEVNRDHSDSNIDNILSKFYSGEFVYHGTGAGETLDRNGIKEFLSIYFAAFPDMNLEIQDLVAEGDKVVYRMTAKGTHKGDLIGIPATGRTFSVRTIGIMMFKDGKVVEEWENFDELGVFRQLGLVRE
ncbi:MAG: ester cyclase [Nitrososphaerota archaeon]